MTNLDSILKSRNITLPTKVHLVKAMVFPVVVYGCESWTTKKAECWWIDDFELWCWRRLLRVPWTAMGSNPSILKEISPGCSLEGLTLKLKLQYFGHLIWRTDWFENTLMLGKIEEGRRWDKREWDGWMASLTQWKWVWVNSRICDGQGDLACCSPWGHKEWDTTEQLNWTELDWIGENESESRSVVSNSHRLYSAWNYQGQNTGVGSHSILQGILSTQGLNPGLLHCRQILY